MNKSIIIYGPQGCGKTLNAKAFCEVFGLVQHMDLADVGIYPYMGQVPVFGHVILAIEEPKDTYGLRCMDFESALTYLDAPHPGTPRR